MLHQKFSNDWKIRDDTMLKAADKIEQGMKERLGV